MNSKIENFFQNRSTPKIAQDLLGRTLTYQSPAGIVGGIIVETEAYVGVVDRAAHSYNGRRSAATEGLYCAGGSLYIYSQRQYFFLDIATQGVDQPEGVLIRAIEPTLNLPLMAANRGKSGYNLTNGPGKLMQAFGVHNRSDDLKFLTNSPFSINIDEKKEPTKIVASKRVGINTSDTTWTNAQLRFFVAGNPYVSHLNKRDYDLNYHGWR